MINGENFFDQPIKNNKVTYENIRKIAAGQGDDYTTGCLLDYSNFMDTYKMIAVDLSKHLMKSIIKPLAKSVLVPLELTAAASVADAGIHKKILGFGHNNNSTLIISNDEMDDILKIVKSLEDSGVLVKQFKMKPKNKEEDFLVCY